MESGRLEQKSRTAGIPAAMDFASSMAAEIRLDKMTGAVLYGVKKYPGSGETGLTGAGSERDSSGGNIGWQQHDD
jgi:hypothetical protein